MGLPVQLDQIRAARERIRGHVRFTPVLEWAPGGNGRPVVLKLEQLQVGGSFKARGACNRILTARPEELAGGVITASGGNHGLGVAYAATRRSLPVTVFLPEPAPASSEQRLRRMGARVERAGAAWDDAWRRAEQRARSSGALLIHPFEDPAVIAGQGTIGLELLDQAPDVDLVLVAIGGGGLISGVALAVKALRPEARVIGVEPTGASSMYRSVAAGHVVELDRVTSIAGTLAPRAVGPNTLALVTACVDDIVLVEDDEMRAAMRQLWDELRILVEPAGAATVAALMSGRVELGGARRVALLVCGANLDAEQAAAAISS